MIVGLRVEHRLAGLHAQAKHRIDPEIADVTMAAEGALRERRRARRILQQHRIIRDQHALSGRDLVRGDDHSGCQKFVPAARARQRRLINRNNEGEIGETVARHPAVIADRAGLDRLAEDRPKIHLEKAVHADQHFRAAVAQRMLELKDARARVDRGGDRADLAAGHQAIGEFRTIGRPERDDVSLAGARRPQASRCRARALAHLRERDPLVAEHPAHAVRPARRRDVQRIAEAYLSYFHVRCRSPDDQPGRRQGAT